jgi:hypothetical protein
MATTAGCGLARDVRGNLIKPDGSPEKGTRRENDYYFYPLLRFDLTRKQFYFLTTDGAAPVATSEAEGVADDGTPLTANVIATSPAPAKHQ